MADAIRAERLGKTYPHSKDAALVGIDLRIPAGSVYGLIGRNGAGKTTFVRIASTQLMPSEGEIWVLGHDAVAEPRSVRARIAVIPQESRPLYFLTIDELVFHHLRMRGMERAEARRRTDQVLGQMGLADRADTLVSRLSGGLRRRAMVAMIFASDAELLFLDEPTTGLDPLARREVWAAIQRAREGGRTVLLTTHYLDEAEALSSRLALIERGRVIVEGTPADIRGRVKYPFRVTLPASLSQSELTSYGEVSGVAGGWLVFAREEAARELTRLALGRNLAVAMAPISLEDIFLQLVGRPLTEGESTGEEVA
ncbi:MAG: ABC transporter ATP-binding protein [Thermoplasmata archaeon]|nr:ABC transporter ATP-binding protein [Thermoplasmata archaeon]